MKNSYAVVLVTVIGVFLAVIKFLALNGFRNRAEFPGDAPLTVEFLLSFFAQLPFGDKLGHDHQLPSHGVGVLYHRLKMTASTAALRLLELGIFYLLKSSNFSETLANESDRNTLKTLQEFSCSVGLPLFLETFEWPFRNLVGKSLFS